MSAHKKRTTRSLGFGLILLCLCYVGFAYTEPLAAIKPVVGRLPTLPPKTVALNWPGYGEAAVGAVGWGVLASRGTSPLPTASVAKILTALAVLKQHPLGLNQNGPMLTLTQADVDWFNHYYSEGGSVVNVQVGEQMSEYQALEAMLLPSANNMAASLAVWAFGSIDAFNTSANALAHQLGMQATTITDPSGFAATTVSTPTDLTMLGEAALASPVITQIVSQPSAIIPVQGVISNVNFLLNQDGIVGIKTGNNDQDQGCFLFAAHRNVGSHILTIVGSIMGAPELVTSMRDSLPLIQSTVSNFSDQTVARAGTPIASYMIPWQGPVEAIPGHDLSELAWNGTPILLSVSITTIKGPLKAGHQVGILTAKSSVSGDSFSEPLVLSRQITLPGLSWRLLHPV